MKRKNHSPAKRIAKLHKAIIKNISIVFCNNLDGCTMFDDKHNHLVRPTETLVDALNHPYQWRVFIAVICRNDVKGDYMKGAVVVPDSRYHHSDLADALTAEHAKLIDSCNPADMISVAWIASPNNREFTEVEAGKIFEKIGAWNDDE